MDPNQSPPTNRWLPVAMIGLILCIYCYPALKTASVTGSHALPPSFAPDSSLYLNISTIKSAGPGRYTDPYYGTTIPSVRMGYLKFRFAFLLFAALNVLVDGHLWWAALLWNLFWWASLCGLAVWFYRRFLPDPSPRVVLAGVAFLMLFNAGVLHSELVAWTHFGFQRIELPDIRPFFPQLPLPLLFFYLGLQIQSLRKSRWWIWGVMTIWQFISFAIFPYVTLLMVMITAVVVLARIFDERLRFSWIAIAIYGAACGILDSLFLLRGGQAARSGAPGETSLVHVQWSILPHRIGGMWLVLALLAGLILWLRKLPPQLKWPVLGLALGNMFLLIGDVFFSPAALQLSAHGGYFVHTTTAILLTVLLSAAHAYSAKNRKAFDLALAATIVFLVLNGIFIARATCQSFQSANQEQAELARALQIHPPSDHDLVIARASLVDDNCSWATLLSNSHVLYCRNAQVLLTPEQNQHTQRFRQAIYLYFTGKDSSWAEHVLEDPNAKTDLSRLLFLGQQDTDSAERNQALDAIRTDLVPLLKKVEARDADVRNFFSGYHRILVIDNAAKPVFDYSRLRSYLAIDDQQTSGSLLVASGSPVQ